MIIVTVYVCYYENNVLNVGGRLVLYKYKDDEIPFDINNPKKWEEYLKKNGNIIAKTLQQNSYEELQRRFRVRIHNAAGRGTMNSLYPLKIEGQGLDLVNRGVFP